MKPIKTASDHKKALQKIESLWSAKPNTPKGDELEILAILVEDYENKHHKILPPEPIEALKFRMEQMHLTKSDIAQYLGGRNRSTEILQKKRPLTVKMIRELHKHLKIPAEALIG
ncbi:MAG: transcriptional regulator [Spirochaetia bacterium]|nr:transcriptional regulator [Spirochaetia bacterium]